MGPNFSGHCWISTGWYAIILHFLKIADSTIKAIPSESEFGVKDTMFDFAIKSMLRCSFGVYFDDDTKVTDLREAYYAVSSNLILIPNESGLVLGLEVKMDKVSLEIPVTMLPVFYSQCWADLESRLDGSQPEAGSDREKAFEKSE